MSVWGMARSARQYYLREIKQVGYTLAKHESWDKFPYLEIKRALIKFASLYSSDLDDYIRDEAAYGCPVRDEAFDKYVQSIAMLKTSAFKPVDIHLGRTLHHFQKHPDQFNNEEKHCYKRIRLLAEANANYKDVERNILKETPYDPKNDIGKNQQGIGLERIANGVRNFFESNRILIRPQHLQFIPGPTEATKELHYILTNYHKRYGYDG